jgi:hypothetical protein
MKKKSDSTKSPTNTQKQREKKRTPPTVYFVKVSGSMLVVGKDWLGGWHLAALQAYFCVVLHVYHSLACKSVLCGFYIYYMRRVTDMKRL